MPFKSLVMYFYESAHLHEAEAESEAKILGSLLTGQYEQSLEVELIAMLVGLQFVQLVWRPSMQIKQFES